MGFLTHISFIVTDSAPKCSNDCKCDVNDYNPICLPELGPIVCWSNLAMTYFLDELGLTAALLQRDPTRLKNKTRKKLIKNRPIVY